MGRARNRVGVVSADDDNGAAEPLKAHEYDKKTLEEKRMQHQKELLRKKKTERRAHARHRKRTMESEPVCGTVPPVIDDREHGMDSLRGDRFTTTAQDEALTDPIERSINGETAGNKVNEPQESSESPKKAKKEKKKKCCEDVEDQPDAGGALLTTFSDLTIYAKDETQREVVELPDKSPARNQVPDSRSENAVDIVSGDRNEVLRNVPHTEPGSSIGLVEGPFDFTPQQPSSTSIISDTKTVSVDEVEQGSQLQIEQTGLIENAETELWPKKVNTSGMTRHGPSDDEAATTIQKAIKRGILRKTKETLSKAKSFIRHSSKVLAEDSFVSTVASEGQIRPACVPPLTLRPRSPTLSSQSERSTDGPQTNRTRESNSRRRSLNSASSSSQSSSLSDPYGSDSKSCRRHPSKNELCPGPSVDMLPISTHTRRKYGEVHHFMAIRIQARVRGMNGRFLAHQRVIEFEREIRDQAMRELEEEASVRIQAQVKGYLLRKRFQMDDVDDDEEDENQPFAHGSSTIQRARTERRRRGRRRQKKHGTVVPHGPQTQRDNNADDDPDMKKVASWPEEFNLEPLDGWDELSSIANAQGETISADHFLSKGRLRVFCGTWNLHAKKPKDDLRLWIALNRYHIVAVGTEECVHSIAKSVVFTSKKQWEDQLKETLGNEYVLVAAHSLTAIHNVVFVHESLVPYLQNVQSDAVATGLGNQLGNKGGVGIAFSIGNTSFAFVNCHFDAHQHNVSKRNANFHRINQELRLFPLKSMSPSSFQLNQVLGKTTSSRFSTSSSPIPTGDGQVEATAARISSGSSSFCQKRPISEAFDRVFWYGDLNYRINGTRRMIDLLLLHNQHDVLRFNDQLQLEMQKGEVFPHFHEGPLNFRPTYKFDKHSNVYDSGSKQRIPSWTDRILYLSNEKPQDVELLSYRSHMNFQTSDHRPVGAVFQVRFVGANIGEVKASTPGEDKDAFARVLARGYKSSQTRSEVCTVQ